MRSLYSFQISADFVIKGGIGSQYRQIGNAVPVRFAYFLGMQIVKALAGCIATEIAV